MTRIVDTNVILRYLLNDEPRLSRLAGDFFEKVMSGEEKAIVPECVIAECVYVLTKYYKVPREKTSEILGGLLHYKGFVNDVQDCLLEALSLFSESSFAIVDCIVYARSRRAGCALMSFDEKLKKYAGKDRVRAEPD